ncbi:MAG: hypothetical protein ACLRX5_05935 [Slackia sp.]
MSAGKLTVEPVDVPKDALPSLRRASGRYVAQSGKLVLPLKYFGLKEGESLIAAVHEFLTNLSEGTVAPSKDVSRPSSARRNR